MSALDEVLVDLRAEHAALGQVLVQLTGDEWERDTHAPGWKVRDQVAHLAHLDAMSAETIAAVRSNDVASSPADEESAPDPASTTDYLEDARSLEHSALLSWWEKSSQSLVSVSAGLDPRERLPWAGRDMSAVSFLTARLMETWSHGLDVVDVVAPERPSADRLRHVLFLGASTRQFSYVNRGMTPRSEDVYVDLVLPSGEPWRFGDPGSHNRISGLAEDFAKVVCRRRHSADTGLEIVGDAAAEWMDVAQTFAGPAGDGRQPGEFPEG